MKPEEEPFVDAFVQYLDALQEATCGRILKREPNPGKLKAAGKKLVEAAGPDLKKKAENISVLVDVLEAQGRLVSRDFYEIKEVADALREFGPRLEKKHGLTLYANISSEGDGIGYLDTCLGKTVAVRTGALHSTIFVKNLVGITGNRLRAANGDTGRCVGWVDDNYGVCHDFEARAGLAMSDWKRFKEPEKEESDWREARLRKIAYSDLFEKFGDDGDGFARAAALNDITNTATHEFHHEKIVGDADACRQIREACAYLYSLAKAQGPETAFAGLHSIYRLRSDPDERYRSASAMALDYLGRAGYSESDWNALEPKDREKKRAVSSRIAGQAKAALKMIETECSLRKHEEWEELLKPDFEGYGSAVRDAIGSALSQER